MEFDTTRRKSKKIKALMVAIVVLIVVFAGIAGFFFWKWQSLKADPKVAAQETSARITEAVGKIYQLPASEEPTVALIQDKQKLKDQSFFEKAQNGDYLLVYQKSKLALLYREKDNRLINVGPISLDNTPSASTQDTSKP
jgi:uncharacterized protein HemX